MPKSHQRRGFNRILHAVVHSVEGLIAAYQQETAFRQECLLALILIPLAFWLHPGALGRALMVGSILLILLVEILNSAIEAVVDRISLDFHLLSKRAKDMGSAAVLLSFILAAAVWGIILVGQP